MTERPLSRGDLVEKLAVWKQRKPEVVVFIGDTELLTPHQALGVKQEKRAKEYNAGFSRR